VSTFPRCGYQFLAELLWEKVLIYFFISNVDIIFAHVIQIIIMEDLLAELKKLSQGISETTKLLEAQVKVNEGKFRSVNEALLQRSIEDGMIRNIRNASEQQLDRIFNKRNRYFRYYEEIYLKPEFIQIKY
jgi:hypothetical protein